MKPQPFHHLCAILRAGLGSGDPARLAQELGRIGDWPGLIQAADRHHVLPVLGPALQRAGLIERLPAEVADLFAFIHGANIERNTRLRHSLIEVVALLNQHGIEPTLLKGAIRLTDDLYPDPGWRIMADLDLLVADQAGRAFELLVARGYRPPDQAGTPEHHLPTLIHPHSGVQIELHRQVLHARVPPILQPAELCRQARPVRLDGAVALLPDPTSQLLHLIVHHQLSNRGLTHGRVSLRTLLEAGLLVAQLRPDEVEAALARLGGFGHRRAGSVLLAGLQAFLGIEPAGFAPDRLDRLHCRIASLRQRHPRLLALQREAAFLAMLLGRLRHAEARQRLMRGLRDPAYRQRRRDELGRLGAAFDPRMRF
ncbi:MAG TPA: nucleotidyltransferase family protein [Geminicoccus sp.]|uniref:nucleotidyltransferase domain-containing protein n=1 Tax=Geminicoccus sp. TaxID=2024832 RepID=UPI002BF877C5|nr:nucleotidyltransferase family protein [Geminicoccus sp.]HWL69183.1 nucleotidyltransferase family protein [Geminicoccus sp.]